MNEAAASSSRVLVLCPVGKDGVLIERVLGTAGIAAHVCADMAQLLSSLQRGAGAVLVAEEALLAEAMLPLRRYVLAQAPWQDLPILILATQGADSPTALEALESLGNVTLLERPLQRVTLISAARAALRATQRQLQLRAYIEERERTADVLRQQTRLLARDIDERKRLEASLRQSERLYRGIGESIDYGVWLSDISGRNTYVSDSLLKLIGANAAQFAGLGWQRYLHPDDAPLIARAWEQCVAAQASWDREYRFRTRDGKLAPILSRGVPLRDEDGKLTGWAGIHLDISRLRQAQETLREADRRKDEFLATLAHELRNPIAPIANAVSVLALREDAQTVRWTRDIIDRQVRHLKRLVDDLLDMSRITQGKVALRIDRVALADVVRAAVEASRPLLDEAGVVLEVRETTEPLEVDGDAVRLAQCLSNLLNNAAKFTPRGGRVELWVERDGEEAVMHVADTGVGIPAEALPTIFDMFSQGERTLERSQGGLGIGLTLVRSFIEMHGGRVEARSSGPGHGSEFVLRIPLSVASREAQPAPAAERHPAGEQRRVLVVDDNVDAAESLSLLLGLEGYDVRTAHDGLAAVGAAETFRPDVVLLDIGMPRLNGYDAARRIRDHEWGASTLIVAITGWGQEADRRRSREAGFDHHLTKPIDSEELLRLIGEAGRGGGRRVA